MGDKDDVLILGVDYNTDCLCLSRNKDKLSADLTNTRRRRLKKGTVDGVNRTSNVLADGEACFLIIDDKSAESEDNDCVEVDSGGHQVSPELYPVIEDGGHKQIDSDNSEKDSLVIPSSKRCKLPHYTDNSTSFLHINTEEHSKLSNNLHISHWEGGHLQKEATSETTELQTHIVSRSVSDMTNSAHQFGPNSNHSAHESTTLQQHELATSTDHMVSSPDISHITASLLSEPMLSVVSELQRTPKCWTSCPNCPRDAERKFHLIDVMFNSAEWAFVSSQLLGSGFTVTCIKRIQNESLWQRLCYEKQLMLRERKDVNEQLLYHTSRSDVAVICEEGLDLRLSVNGNFGCGIYFSDDPLKCNSYWRGGGPMERYMFCCRVLLGDIKIYPKGKAERLKREPLKETMKLGDRNKYYDSVMGNLSGENEFVVYNAYRVMPEYVLYYMLPNHAPLPSSSITQLSQCSVLNSFWGRYPVHFPAPQHKSKKKKSSQKRK